MLNPLQEDIKLGRCLSSCVAGMLIAEGSQDDRRESAVSRREGRMTD